MSGVLLGAIAPSAPFCLATLQCQLDAAPWPARTVALLGEACRPRSEVRGPRSGVARCCADLVGATHASPLPPAAGIRAGRSRTRRRTSDFGHRTPGLGSCTSDEDVGSAASATLSVGLRDLVEALATGDGDRDRYDVGVRRLAGLGPGLTPTGDDLLVALLAAGRLLAHAGLLPASGIGALEAAIASIPAGVTTDVAASFLRSALAGLFPEPLAALVSALGDPSADHHVFAGLVGRVAATGAHSGADWAAGVVALTSACLVRARRAPRAGAGSEDPARTAGLKTRPTRESTGVDRASSSHEWARKGRCEETL